MNQCALTARGAPIMNTPNSPNSQSALGGAVFRLCTALVMLAAAAAGLHAAEAPESPKPLTGVSEGVPVTIWQIEITRFRLALGPVTPEMRAERAVRRIEAIPVEDTGHKVEVQPISLVSIRNMA